MKIVINKQNITSFIFATTCAVFLISNYVHSFMGNSIDIGDYILAICLFMLLLLQPNRIPSIRKYWLTFLIVGFWGISIFYTLHIDDRGNIANGYLKYYVVFCVIALLVTNLQINVELFLRILMLYAVPIVLLGSRFWSQTSVERLGGASTSMGASYALLPCAIAFLIHVVYYRKKNVFFVILYLINLVCTLRLLFTGTRGSIIGLLLVIYYVIIDKNRGKANNKKIITAFTLLFFIVAIVLINQNVIISKIYNFLSAKDIYINVIYKSYHEMARKSSFLNGRDALWAYAREMISNNIAGVGIGGYESVYQIYPHNLIMELILEYGWIFGGILIVFIVILFFKNITISLDVKTLIILFFFCAIPRLMVSSTYWKDQFFWFFIVYGTYNAGSFYIQLINKPINGNNRISGEQP